MTEIHDPDILDYLDSGLDNVERGDSGVELGGVLLTMKDAAQEIRLLRIAVTRYCEKWRMGTVEPQDVQQAIDRAFERS